MTASRATAALPVLAICGHSGSGKTTLIEALVPQLRAWGWRVAVLKRTRHAIAVDVAGKDSDRFFRAGASVCMQAAGEGFLRVAAVADDGAWPPGLHQLLANHDFVLVEGHKETPLPKVWLLGPGEREPPRGIVNVVVTLGRDEPRLEPTRALCQQRATKALAARPLLGAVVLDRDHPRAQVADAVAGLGRWAARTLIVGDLAWPGLSSLPPVRGVSPRSLAHTLAALRWDPDAAWLVVRPGPGLTAEALTALMERRRPGRWTLAAAAGVDATLFEPQARAELEAVGHDGSGGESDRVGGLPAPTFATIGP